jgi:hypothetical protein
MSKRILYSTIAYPLIFSFHIRTSSVLPRNVSRRNVKREVRGPFFLRPAGPLMYDELRMEVFEGIVGMFVTFLVASKKGFVNRFCAFAIKHMP